MIIYGLESKLTRELSQIFYNTKEEAEQAIIDDHNDHHNYVLPSYEQFEAEQAEGYFKYMDFPSYIEFQRSMFELRIQAPPDLQIVECELID